jgi:hypothetical protein
MTTYEHTPGEICWDFVDFDVAVHDSIDAEDGVTLHYDLSDIEDAALSFSGYNSDPDHATPQPFTVTLDSGQVMHLTITNRGRTDQPLIQLAD